MNEPQSIDAPRPNFSTGPKTPEGKTRSRLNAYRHGLTGQFCVITPEEQQAYEAHSVVVIEALAPVGAFERDIAQSIADDRWRLKRARAIEFSTFAIGMQDHAEDKTGLAQVDDALSQARTWGEQARNLDLLTVYAQRIQRAVEKNMTHLNLLQTQRKEIATEAMRQAKLLYQLALAEGRPYQPEEIFVTAPEVRESVFSTPQVAYELSREILLADAKTHKFRHPSPNRKAVLASAQAPQSSAGESLHPPTEVKAA